MGVERKIIEVECIGGALDGNVVEIDPTSQFFRSPRISGLSNIETPREEISSEVPVEYDEYILVRNPRNPGEKVLLARYLYDKMMKGGLHA